MKKAIDFLIMDKAQCCGCGTCALVCPMKAITMVPQELGCLYPKIDTEKCIDCHLCEQSCAYHINEENESAQPHAFAAMAKDKELLNRSASGGVFAAVANGIVEAGGAVFGCSLEMKDGVLTPVHICVETQAELVKLQGSKYVQSMLTDTFVQVKQMLKQGRMVLFSGTPCQVDALKHFVRDEDASRLYTIDIICHGVPSAKLFQEYVDLLGNGNITSFVFRDKVLGWGLNARYTITTQGNKVMARFLSPGISSYYSFFLDSEIYRESCYSCRYAKIDRVGDITIGDFWGIEKEHPEYLAENNGIFQTNEGVSAILVNTSKGRDLLEQYGHGLEIAQSHPENVAKWNRQLQGPSVHSEVRDEIMRQYDARGYAGVEKLFRKRLGIRYYIRKVKQLRRLV